MNMKPNTQKLYELVVEANDIFVAKNSQVDTSVGLMNSALRKKGINADAITVDAILSKNRLIFILLDTDTTTVGIGLGNIVKDDINLIEQVALQTLTKENIAEKLISYVK